MHVIDSFEEFCGLAGNPLLRDKQELRLVHLISRVVLLGDLVHESRRGQGLAVRQSEALLI